MSLGGKIVVQLKSSYNLWSNKLPKKEADYTRKEMYISQTETGDSKHWAMTLQSVFATALKGQPPGPWHGDSPFPAMLFSEPELKPDRPWACLSASPVQLWLHSWVEKYKHPLLCRFSPIVNIGNQLLWVKHEMHRKYFSDDLICAGKIQCLPLISWLCKDKKINLLWIKVCLK